MDNVHFAYTSDSELYDPATGTWTAAAPLPSPRGGQTAILLRSGKVLVTEGADDNGFVAASELYDPATDTWASAGNLPDPRDGAPPMLLPSGKVLITGGIDANAPPYVTSDSELYDPAHGACASPHVERDVAWTGAAFGYVAIVTRLRVPAVLAREPASVVLDRTRQGVGKVDAYRDADVVPSDDGLDLILRGRRRGRDLVTDWSIIAAVSCRRSGSRPWTATPRERGEFASR